MDNEVRKEVGGLDLLQAEFDFLGSRWTFRLSFGRDELSAFLSLLFFGII